MGNKISHSGNIIIILTTFSISIGLHDTSKYKSILAELYLGRETGSYLTWARFEGVMLESTGKHLRTMS